MGTTTSYANLTNLLDQGGLLIPDIREVFEFKHTFVVLSFDQHANQFFVHYVEKEDTPTFTDVGNNAFDHTQYDQAYQRYIRLVQVFI